MKHWFLIDDCMSTRSFSDTEHLQAASLEDALLEAQRRWDSLSPHDQRQRDAYYVCRAELDEDGCIDYDSVTDEHSII